MHGIDNVQRSKMKQKMATKLSDTESGNSESKFIAVIERLLD